MDKYRVKPGQKLDLSKIDPADTSEFNGDKDDAKGALKKLVARLDALQDVLYAQQKHKLLVVLQATDTGGKDGAVRDVFSGANPQGINVVGFKVPTPEEMAHDFLWRIHKQTPRTGEIKIFNRSHYEDVLVARVHKLVPEKVWRQRYDHIAQFEKLLADEGTTILKFYLHIDKAEQKERLEARLADPNKHWKFNVGDLEERKLWSQYVKAYEEAISKTSMAYAPWYVVPSNKKWYRNLVIATAVVNALEGLKMSYPESKEDLSKVVVD